MENFDMDRQTMSNNEELDRCEEFGGIYTQFRLDLNTDGFIDISSSTTGPPTNSILADNGMKAQEDAIKMTTRRRKFKRRPRKHRPGKRKRKSLRRNTIPRSKLGAPFLCNDMVMAKDGWVFDRSSGKIEFKPEVAHEQPQNFTVPNADGNRYIPVSPERDMPNGRHCCSLEFDVHDEQSVKSPPSTNCDSGFVSPGKEELSISPSHNTQSEIVSEHDKYMSILCESDEDFKFHMQNFEEDTDQYLRECLMGLSRENLEAEYYSNLKKLRSLESDMDINNNFEVLKLECVDTSVNDISIVQDHLTEGMETLQQLTSTITCQVRQLQQENSQLKEENHRLRVAIDI